MKQIFFVEKNTQCIQVQIAVSKNSIKRQYYINLKNVFVTLSYNYSVHWYGWVQNVLKISADLGNFKMWNDKKVNGSFVPTPLRTHL